MAEQILCIEPEEWEELEELDEQEGSEKPEEPNKLDELEEPEEPDKPKEPDRQGGLTMNGIEIANIITSAAVIRQKDSRAEQTETKNARAEQIKQEEAGKYNSIGRSAAGNDDGVQWVRNERGENGNPAASWRTTGNSNGTNRPGSGNPATSWRTTGNNNGTNRPGSGNTAHQPSTDKTGKNKLNSKENTNTQTNKTTPNGQKNNAQTGQTTGNAQKGIGQINQTNQTGIETSRFGQTNNLSPVNRQRLAQQKKAKTAAKKKSLNYNRREVSSQVLRANKIGSAARALATARTKVSSLRRCVGTGQYDENELRIAISHAESIVKTAKKKVANLKEEQIKERHVAREKQTNALKKKVKKQRLREKRQQVKREAAMQKSQMERQTKMKELRYKQLKRRHRGEELADVVEADVKYIKDMDRYHRYGGSEGSSRTATDTTGTAALEIGDSAMRLNELERTEQALKYEEQQMGESAATFSGSSASGSMDISVGDGISSGGGEISVDLGGAEMAALGGSVDISL